MSSDASSPTLVRKPKTRKKPKKPKMYRVLLHNDDYTSMEFVVEILRSIFRKKEPDAERIMLNVHFTGIGLCGIYTLQVAETKVRAVHQRARQRGFPLRASMEPEG